MTSANDNTAFRWDGDVGHSWLSISQVINGQKITRTFGFYPNDKAYPDGSSGSTGSSRDVSVLANDSGHHFDVSVLFDITSTELTQLVDYTVNQMPSRYELSFFNCTNFVVKSCGAAGLTLPQNIGNWILGGGLNPGRFGQDIRTYDVPGKLEHRELSSGLADSNVGDCN